MEKHEDMVEVKKTGHRHSVMSLEVPITPTSSSGHSIAESEEHELYNHDFPEADLRPHLSHASSAGAVGGIVPSLRRTQSYRSGRSIATTAASTDPAFEVDFTANDPENPQNWSLLKKCMVIGFMSYATTGVVLYSTAYTSGIPGMQAEWGISEVTGVLGMTTYLFGIACGSLILAPLSEMYGRRPIYIISTALFILFVLPCALAQNIGTVLTCRFLAAAFASSLISNAPGSVNDIVDEEHRALAFSVWSIGPINGPVIGPVVGGFVFQYLGWRWTNWVVVIVSAVGWVAVASIPETYAPVMLRKKAAKLRKETGDDRYWSRYDEKTPLVELLKINLSRPFILVVQEPILIFWDIYVALVYALLYLCFVSYPIVFDDIRGWSPGIGGLAFSGIGLGTLIIIIGEPLIRKVINSHKLDPETGKPPPEAGVFICCISAVLLPIGELWFAWTCTPEYHWAIPIAAGIPFGMGNAGIFIYSSNYLVHSYGMYAASALAGNAVLRSIMGATIPLAGPALYSHLGSNWAGTVLGLLELICVPIPFVFYRYGHKIRQKSPLIRKMQEDRRRLDAKREKSEKRAMRRADGEASAGFAMDTAAAMDEEIDEEKAIHTVNKHSHKDAEATVTQVVTSSTVTESDDVESGGK